MLTLTFPSLEEGAEPIELEFEHSLVSLSKWESVYEKSFFRNEPKTEEESKAYIIDMLVSKNAPKDLIDRLNNVHIRLVDEYINSSQTGTTFREDQTKSPNRQIITSELVYSWMVTMEIPIIPCETWHFNRLITLVRIITAQKTPPKKMSRSEQMADWRRINEERRKNLGSTG